MGLPQHGRDPGDIRDELWARRSGDVRRDEGPTSRLVGRPTGHATLG